MAAGCNIRQKRWEEWGNGNCLESQDSESQALSNFRERFSPVFQSPVPLPEGIGQNEAIFTRNLRVNK